MSIEVPNTNDASHESIQKWLESIKAELKLKLQEKLVVLDENSEDFEEEPESRNGGFSTRYH